MKQIIDRVTLTGANQRTDIQNLQMISERWQCVEWGILLSKNSMGVASRFPSRTWLQDLGTQMHLYPGDDKMKLSGHLCGRWVRDVCKGEWTFLKDLGELVTDQFERIQLNFHAEVHRLDRDKFIQGFTSGPGKKYAEGRQFIFQMDDVNNDILDVAREAGVDAVPLFDLSGGAGVLPENWPKASGYCGYAGGLSPGNVATQLALIEQAVGNGPAWIDVETHVRSDNDRTFDLEMVEAFIRRSMPWVK